MAPDLPLDRVRKLGELKELLRLIAAHRCRQTKTLHAVLGGHRPSLTNDDTKAQRPSPRCGKGRCSVEPQPSEFNFSGFRDLLRASASYLGPHPPCVPQPTVFDRLGLPGLTSGKCLVPRPLPSVRSSAHG